MTEAPLLEVEGLVKHFPLRRGSVLKRTVGAVRALDGVSFELHQGETLGVVGESGCGKSTLARTLVCLEEPTAGTVSYQGRDIHTLPREELRALRRQIQIVFQDPYASLDPRMRVGDIVQEPWRVHPGVLPKAQWHRRTQELLEHVGLDPGHTNRYPHQFSGGQRQRIALARALALHPRVLVCDEPVSALDVSVQAQIVNLLARLQREYDLTVVFIAHDLALVRQVCDRVAVMYLGRIVEMGSESQIYDHPAHPYTRALLAAAPVPDPTRARRRVVAQGIEDPAGPYS